MRDAAESDPTSWLPESNSQSDFGRLAWLVFLYIWISVRPKIYHLRFILSVKVGRYPGKVFSHIVNWSPSGNPADAMGESLFPDANLWSFVLPDIEESQAATALKGSSDQEVQAWLAFSRKGGFQLPSSNHRLAQKHVDAYRVLQGHDDLVVLRWVHEAQSIGRSCVL